MMSKDGLLKQLTALDFFAVDLQLFLDTHPTDREALAKYNAVVADSAKVRQQYESMYGPVWSYRSPSQYPWQWINDPWPWQNNFNFKLAGDED